MKKNTDGKGSRVRGLLNGLRSLLVRFLDRVTSKDPRTIFFGSNMGRYFYGSPKALFDYMKEKHADEFEMYYYLDREETGDTRCICKGRFFRDGNLGKFLRAGTVIGSHGMYDFGPWGFSKKKKLINTWHGVPLKTIGFSYKKAPEKLLKEIEARNALTDILLVASDFEAELFEKAFRLKREKIKCLGHPGNDMLVEPARHPGPEFLKKLPEHEHLILYCPTWRNYADTILFPFDDFDPEALGKFLDEKKAVILLRSHINEEDRGTRFRSDRIVEFSFDTFPDVNEILPHIHMLMTDYSSIYFDYLLVDRPMIFLPYDLETYEKERGFMLDDYDKWTPGPKADSFESLIRIIEETMGGKDDFKERRGEINKTINAHQTAHSCEKVVEYLKSQIGEQPRG
jgi:CDP-glycerol glycerophosphotransferase